MPVDLEIVSPERLLLSQPVDMVVVPAAEGELGVLPGHSPMIVLLRGGTIVLHEGGRPTARLYVTGGFAEITPERCTVLADRAVPVSELSLPDAERGLVEAREALERVDRLDMVAVDAAMARLQQAEAMVEAARPR
jgi:F-type H+-transporting ATPase subunit epsilon